MTSHPHASPAAAALAGAAHRAPGISLAELLERAELQVRLDRKYLLTAADLSRLAVRLDGELDVLDIDGLRSFGYESLYFDTPTLQTYREHLAGRTDRFKLRTRSYVDSGETMFEVKLESPDGGTIKRRSPHLASDRHRLTSRARRHLSAALAGAGRSTPRGLEPACTTAYQRSTFVTRDGHARITCDHDLVCSDDHGTVASLDGHVLVEVKSAQAESPVDRALAGLGVAQVSISKYCVGVALLHPELPCEPWKALLGRYFGRPARLAAV